MDDNEVLNDKNVTENVETKQKDKKQKKIRAYMFEQQLRFMPMPPKEYYDLIMRNSKPTPEKIAMIIHDKDVQDDGVTPAEPHVHIMIEYENPRSPAQVAKELDIEDNPQLLNYWNNKVENGFSYLIHATNTSRHKHQYSCDEVQANFNYTEYIAEISKKVERIGKITKANKINTILDWIGSGEKTVKEVKEQLTGSEYALNADKIKKAHELYLERKANELHQEMIENEEMVEVHWFYGISETGKSFLAEKLASEGGLYYKTTTTKDAFQFYQAEPILILDELRQRSIPYSELLALLNPFSKGNVAVSSRFYNKALAVRTIYITTPFDPVAFYGAYKVKDDDSGVQLYRRLSSVLKFDMDFIFNMKYEYSLNAYVEIGRKPNPYSKRHQKQYELNNIFNKI